MFHADEVHTRAESHTHTHSCTLAYTRSFIVHHFWPVCRQEDSPWISCCLGKQSAFCKGVRQKDEQFVVTIVLPAHSWDLAVPCEQLAAGYKDTFCDLSPLLTLALAIASVHLCIQSAAVMYEWAVYCYIHAFIFWLVIHMKGLCKLLKNWWRRQSDENELDQDSESADCNINQDCLELNYNL